MVTEITVTMFKSFEKFLRSPRTISRENQFKRIVKTGREGITDAGLYNYMRDLRTLFNEARELYND
jgi:hypothetical protein